MSQEYEYFKELERKLENSYDVAKEARSKGKDPSLEPEIPVAENMAMRVEGLVGPEGVGERLKELDEEVGREMASFRIAKEIVTGKFGDMEKEDAAEQAIRTALAIMTEGIVAAPLEGIADVRVREDSDGSEHLAIYFAGPIRSAGGTAQALSVLIGEYVRDLLKLDKYKPREEEVERYVEEINLYERHVTTLQYSPSLDEVRDVIKNTPIEITGESTSDKNVEGYKNLERVETNGIRGGAVLVIAEGILQKINKMLRYINNLNMSGWGWLRKFNSSDNESDEESNEDEVESKSLDDNYYDKIDSYRNEKYMKDLIAGRPLFGLPSRRGGFRLRYGRSRNSGFATWSIHPATMAVLDDFLAVGTQMKTELPGKACITTPNSDIDGPIVKLDNGDVVRLNSEEEAYKALDSVDEIIYLGDALVCFGEFVENNHELTPSPYVEEWWVQDLTKRMNGSGFDLEPFDYNVLDKEISGIDENKLVKIIESPMKVYPSFDESLYLSNKFDIPLHPRYLYYWSAIKISELEELIRIINDSNRIDEGIVVSSGKSILEDLGIPHKVKDNNLLIPDPWCKPLEFLCDDLGAINEKNYRNALEYLKDHSSVMIKNKGPVFVGGRMGRPEKSKERKMSPPVHVLFPISDKGGRTRNVVEAAKHGSVEVQAAELECPKCGTLSTKKICPECGVETDLVMHCPECGDELKEEECPKCNVETVPYQNREFEIKNKFSEAVENSNKEGIGLVKGVEGMSSKYKLPEPLMKGVLRSKNDVYVYKDGTSRFDITDAPLTHFKPKEINISVELLRKNGYKEDINGRPLRNEDQIVELKPQDILLPDNAADYLVNVANFIDSLLSSLYDMDPYYNVQKREDLVGELVIGLAPHTSAGVIGRILGFTKAKVGYAHPYFHAAKRRNCDGDEDAVMLVLDGLINFSNYYLPNTRGGKMDAPLVVTTRIDPNEVDDEVHNMDIANHYSKDFYENTYNFLDPKEVDVEIVEERLDRDDPYSNFNFTHDTSNISDGPEISSYKTLGSMEEKIRSQFGVISKLRSVEEPVVAAKVIEKHFIPDLIGNLRSFSGQSMRCVDCNSKFRRIPLRGKCTNCGGKLVLTVSQGSVEKYLDMSEELIEKYSVPTYTKHRVELIKKEIASMFESDRQTSITDFF